MYSAGSGFCFCLCGGGGGGGGKPFPPPNSVRDRPGPSRNEIGRHFSCVCVSSIRGNVGPRSSSTARSPPRTSLVDRFTPTPSLIILCPFIHSFKIDWCVARSVLLPVMLEALHPKTVGREFHPIIDEHVRVRDAGERCSVAYLERARS